MEAIAACFCITGHEDWAQQVLSHFSWGSAFFEINRELLDIYATCTDAEDVRVKQEDWMLKLEQEYQDRRTGGDTTDDMWTSGNANHDAMELPPESDAKSSKSLSEEEDADLWTTDKLGNKVRKTDAPP